VELLAYEALVANKAYEAVSGTFNAYDAVKAYDALVDADAYEAEVDVNAYDALVALLAHEAVPNKDPVTPPKAVNDPLTIKEPVTNSCEEVIICTTIVCAVNVPATVKLLA
jgi:hypothetical protein